MVTSIVAVIVGVVITLDRVGVFARLGLTRPSSDAAATELSIADRALSRLTQENAQLQATRSLEPVLAVLERVSVQNGQNAKSQQEVLDRLAHHNGSFRHMEETLSLLAEGVKALTGTIAEMHDIPLSPPQRREQV